MDSKRKAKDDAKGLDRLFKLTVFGSALIIVIYSIYYYANAYKQSKTNTYRVSDENDIILTSMDYKAKIAAENIIFSNNQEVALLSGTQDWALVNRPKVDLNTLAINSRTTVALSGIVSEGFDAIFTDELVKRYNSIPPIVLEKNLDGILVKSVQFEHFIFPFHAMINWRSDEVGHKTFSFIVDSMPGNFESFHNGFRWLSDMHNEYIWVQMCAKGDSVGPTLRDHLRGNTVTKRGYTMPILDFDLIFNQDEHLKLSFENRGIKKPVVASEGEIKMLIGPSLKQGKIYEIADRQEGFLNIVPPFWISLSKEKEGKPYFFALITNEKLLLH